MVETVQLSVAKAKLSALVRQVETVGAEFLITSRGEPVARLVPAPREPSQVRHARAILAGKRPRYSRDDEREAYREAMEAHHGD